MKQLLHRVFNLVVAYWHGVCWFLAAAAFWAALFEDPNHEDTGAFAAFIVLCVASAALAELARGSDQIRKWPAILGAVATFAAAYLFVASESGAHPTDPVFLGGLGVVWGLASVMVMVVGAMIALTRWSDRE